MASLIIEVAAPAPDTAKRAAPSLVNSALGIDLSFSR
jgi:hypothetical protein